MTPSDALHDLRARMLRELDDRILPYWAGPALDEAHGGWHGRIGQDGRVDASAGKGGILHARILWTYAAAFRVRGDDRWRRLADRAWAYLADCFLDAEHGGVFWMTAPDGTPTDDRKHVYAQAFAVYALAEHHRATGAGGSLEQAIHLYRCIERHGADRRRGGYREAFARDWRPLDDVRLSAKDEGAPRSMNTHLHVLEAYTTLYRVWPDPALAERLRVLLGLFLGSVVDGRTGHLVAFFHDDWSAASGLVSYGHDIEASWLLLEAADVLGEAPLRARVRDAAVRLARTVLDEGVDADGGLLNEVHADGRLDDDKHWWPQAEAVVGFLNAYDETGDLAFLDAARGAWAFVEARVLDRDGGEWFGRLRRDGTPYPGEDKVGPWKCPYHNARACLEVAERVPAPASPTPSASRT